MPLLPLAMLALGLAGQDAPAAMAEPMPDNDKEVVIVRGMRPSRDRLMRTVFVGDLDLKTDGGRREMESRVGKAVDDMCAIPTPLPTYGEKMTKPCRDEAWDSARPQMERMTKAAAPQ